MLLLYRTLGYIIIRINLITRILKAGIVIMEDKSLIYKGTRGYGWIFNRIGQCEI